MMVGDQCWQVREGQPAAARSSATRSTSPAKNTTSSKPPLARQDCSVYPVVVLATAWTGAGEAPDSVRKVRSGRPGRATTRTSTESGCGRSDWWG
jgi:hypothetical protein